jgi:hypothetical protein
MQIIIHNGARKNLTEDEYKYLILLEFNKKFEESVKRIRKELGIPKPEGSLDLEKLYDKSLALVLELKIPITLLLSIEDLIHFGVVLRATLPILVLGIKNQFNRKLLYNSKIYPSSSKHFPTEPQQQVIGEVWYRNNREVLKRGSLATACPLIQINKKLTKPQLLKAIEEDWDQIEAAMDDFEKSTPYLIVVSAISTIELEENILIYRYRAQGLDYGKIREKLISDHKKYIEEATLRKRYSDLKKVLKKIGFVSN